MTNKAKVRVVKRSLAALLIYFAITAFVAMLAADENKATFVQVFPAAMLWVFTFFAVLLGIAAFVFVIIWLVKD